jgi:H+/Cl- antiporter ClcA
VYLARRFLRGDGGHPPLQGIGGGAVPVSHAPGIALAAIGTLAFGAVLGPEAPLIALGAAVGMVFTLIGRIDEKAKAVLATAGSFSAISALFGGPVVGGVMMVESGLAMGTALLAVLLPGFVAAAVGYVLFVGLGDWGGLASQGLAVPSLPPYNGTHVYDLLIGIGVGVVAAVIIAAIRRLAGELAKEGPRRLGLGILLLGGGLAVGLLHRSPNCWARTRRTCSSPGRRPSRMAPQPHRAGSSFSCWRPSRTSTTCSALDVDSAAGRSSRRSSSASP